MDLFEILGALTTLAALFSWVNFRFIGLPTAIGLMLIALVFSLVLIALGRMGFGIENEARAILKAMPLDQALMHGMLGALLFAGSLHVNLNELATQGRVIGTLATIGVVTSTLIIGIGASSIGGWLGIDIPFMYWLLFGSLVSPTDPIAVLAALKRVHVPKTLEVKIAGESLFNDGFAVVLFLVLLAAATGADSGETISSGEVVRLLLQEAIGGVLFGLVIGWVAYLMLRSIDDYQIEILITLAVVTGGYALAHALHTSGPLAMVVAGLLIGNHGRSFAMSDRTRERLDDFWELIDELLNALLFMWVGFEVLIMSFEPTRLTLGLLCIPLMLLARWLSVRIPVLVLSRSRTFSPHATAMLTWGGLRGGISVALALSLPESEARPFLVVATYILVTFSVLVQGLTLETVAKRFYGTED
ncbi:MAG: sodium:proton antiporter [bacterium]|nr:sodium:proton antiporter [bacterium]